MAREGSTRNTSQVAGAWAPVGISRCRRQVALHISSVLGEKNKRGRHQRFDLSISIFSSFSSLPIDPSSSFSLID